MNTKRMITAGLLLGTFLSAQESPTAPDQGVKTEAKSSIGGWIQDLGSDRFKTRNEAESKLREVGKDALPALRKAADSDADGEVQWRAKRLIREIENGAPAVPLQRREQSRADTGSEQAPQVRERFDEMFRRLEQDFGIDVPRARFFQDGFFRDLDQQFQDMQQRLQGMQQGPSGVSQGMTMRIGQDGVHVEVQEKNEKGEVETKKYDAPDMETFQKMYPDVLKGNGLGEGMQFWLGDAGQALPFDMRGFARVPTIQVQPHQLQQLDLQPLAPRFFSPSGPDASMAPPAEGERLGVRIRPEIAPAVREYLGLEVGTGVWIEEVQDGSLALDLGLAAGDIVTKIGGKAVGSPADIRAALGPIEAGHDVEVVFLRKGAEKTVKAAKKAGAVEAADAKREPGAGKGLQPRRSGSQIR